MKLHWGVSEILKILWVKVMGLFQTVKIVYESNMQIYSWYHFRWMTKYMLSHPHIYRACFRLIFSNLISSHIHLLIYLLSPAFHYITIMENALCKFLTWHHKSGNEWEVWNKELLFLESHHKSFYVLQKMSDIRVRVRVRVTPKCRWGSKLPRRHSLHWAWYTCDRHLVLGPGTII
jgi:hypothetical protein